MSADRNTAPQVGDNQVQFIVLSPDPRGINPRYGFLIQSVENRDPAKQRVPADAGYVVQFVHDDRIGDISLRIRNPRRDFDSQQSAQVRGVLALRSVDQIPTQRVVHLVHARSDRFDQSPAPDNRRQRVQRNTFLLQNFQNQIPAKTELVGHAGERPQLLRRVTDRPAHRLRFIEIHRNFRRSRTGVDRQYSVLFHPFLLFNGQRSHCDRIELRRRRIAAGRQYARTFGADHHPGQRCAA